MPSDINPTTSPSTSPSDRKFLGCLGLAALVFLVVCTGFLINLPRQKKWTPAEKLELTTVEVPLSHQVLVLVDDFAGSPYAQVVRDDVLIMMQDLGEEAQICIHQVRSDHAIMPVEPWCSQQIKLTWWVMPEVKPAPYKDQAEEQAYAQARVRLEQQLSDYQKRATDSWVTRKTERNQQVLALFSQLPRQRFHSLEDSLRQLMTKHVPGVPVDMYIYSSLQDQLFGQVARERVDLSSVQKLMIWVLSPDLQNSRLNAKQEWGGWLGESGLPQDPFWSLIQPLESQQAEAEAAPKAGPVRTPRKASHLPPIVSKAPRPDRTNLVKGEVPSRDVTSVVREVPGE